MSIREDVKGGKKRYRFHWFSPTHYFPVLQPSSLTASIPFHELFCSFFYVIGWFFFRICIRRCCCFGLYRHRASNWVLQFMNFHVWDLIEFWFHLLSWLPLNCDASVYGSQLYSMESLVCFLLEQKKHSFDFTIHKFLWISSLSPSHD